MNPPTPPTVAVIGGGIAGLAAAWELSETAGPGTRVIVFEAASRFGGKLRTETFGGREVELGPDAFVARRPEALALCTELGLGPDLVAPGARRAYVWARGRLRPLPAGLALGVPTRLGPLVRAGSAPRSASPEPALDLLRPALGTASRARPGRRRGRRRAASDGAWAGRSRPGWPARSSAGSTPGTSTP